MAEPLSKEEWARVKDLQGRMDHPCGPSALAVYLPSIIVTVQALETENKRLKDAGKKVLTTGSAWLGDMTEQAAADQRAADFMSAMEKLQASVEGGGGGVRAEPLSKEERETHISSCQGRARDLPAGSSGKWQASHDLHWTLRWEATVQALEAERDELSNVSAIYKSDSIKYSLRAVALETENKRLREDLRVWQATAAALVIRVTEPELRERLKAYSTKPDPISMLRNLGVAWPAGVKGEKEKP
jgi:FtsZ-binding cell division protein ZapB